MIRRLSFLILTGSVVLLGGCSTSPPVKYYGLQVIDAEYRIDPEGAPLLVIGPLRVAEYLKRSQMVSRARGSEIIVDDFNRWAEPLDSAIHSTIAANVDALLDDTVVIAFPYSPVVKVTHRVIGRITRFDVNADGLAVLDIQWGVGDANGQALAEARRTRYTAMADGTNDPAAMAIALSDTIEQLSREIATEMETMIR